MLRLQALVAAAEQGHGGEIRVAVESCLDLHSLLRGVTARERALSVFANLRVWDTEENNGVLLYVLLADRDVEIVADRGVARRVGQEDWESMCQEMEALFRAGQAEQALATGLGRIGRVLSELYPGSARGRNELPDRPAVLD
ncbi:TPM domain-containing protein [Parasulfuritortus cantonensis]|uniref:TPM domain-containing protein n=1 Tax=Parasulfuritortus cantonensis TaxID=2528202 RepID=UPI001F0EB100|nr:TPM domain-containing protein [Parasulfuritortus cantonensis]